MSTEFEIINVDLVQKIIDAASVEDIQNCKDQLDDLWLVAVKETADRSLLFWEFNALVVMIEARRDRLTRYDFLE